MRSIVAAAMLACTAPIVEAGADPPAGTERPPTSGFVLAPAIVLDGFGVDTNILAASEDPKRDVTANLRMQIEPSRQAGPATIRGKAGVALAYFQQYAAQRSTDADGSLRVDVRFNRFLFYGAGSAVRIRDSFGPEIDLRVRRIETAMEGGGELRVSGKTWVTAGARRSRLAFFANELLFDSSLREALDRTIDTQSVGARHALTPLTTVVAMVEMQQDRFSLWPLRDTNGTRVLAGAEFKPTALISGKAHVGYRRFISRDTTQPNVDGIVASVDLAYTFVDALRFGVRVERDLGHSYSVTERYFAWTDLRFSVTRRVNSRWDITAMAGRRVLDYRGALGPAPGVEPVDHALRYGGAIEYRIGNFTTLGVTGEYAVRDSELTGRKYDRLRLLSSVAYRF